MIETLRMLEASGIVDDVIINDKGSLSTYNMVIRSMTEKQPTRNRPTEFVYGRDGNIDMSQLYGSVTYSRREFRIVFNIYAEVGDRNDQAKVIREWLMSGEGQTMQFSLRPNTIYSGLRVDVGDLVKDSGSKGKYQSTLTVNISTDPYYQKDGELII